MTVVLTRYNNIGVTHDGLVRMGRGRMTAGYEHPWGHYLRVNLDQGAVLVHRLVAQTLVHNPAPGVLNVVHHKNPVIKDNRSSNLQWVTQQLNTMMKQNAKGCYFNKRKKLWQAYCKVKGVRHKLGWFKTYEAGHAAYLKFREAEFNRILKQTVRDYETQQERASRFIS